MTDTPLITSADCGTLEATVRFASKLASVLKSGDILALEGDLGSGKTVFARAVIQALCGEDIEVPSPTFNLLLTYDTREKGIPLYHYDLYRLEQPEEVLELDIEDAFEEGISLIEWPGQMAGYLPPTALTIQIEILFSPEGRKLSLYGDGNWADRLSQIGEDEHA